MTPTSEDVQRIVRPKLFDQPEYCPGGYVMHFYCKYENPAHPWSNIAPPGFMQMADQVETRTAAIRQMRNDGWKYHRDGTATCPLCAKMLALQASQITREE